jgi:serine/threonine protein kinase
VAPSQWVLAVISDVGEGLLYAAKRHRILHMDLCLSNVMVTPLERKVSLPRAALIDFGCALQIPDTAVGGGGVGGSGVGGSGGGGGPLRMERGQIPKGWVMGNVGHIAPEVHAALSAPTGRPVLVDFSKQVHCTLRCCSVLCCVALCNAFCSSLLCCTGIGVALLVQ